MQSRRSSKRAEREDVTTSGTVQSSSSCTTSATEERREGYISVLVKNCCRSAVTLKLNYRFADAVKKAVFNFLF